MPYKLHTAGACVVCFFSLSVNRNFVFVHLMIDAIETKRGNYDFSAAIHRPASPTPPPPAADVFRFRNCVVTLRWMALPILFSYIKKEDKIKIPRRLTDANRTRRSHSSRTQCGGVAYALMTEIFAINISFVVPSSCFVVVVVVAVCPDICVSAKCQPIRISLSIIRSI